MNLTRRLISSSFFCTSLIEIGFHMLNRIGPSKVVVVKQYYAPETDVKKKNDRDRIDN